MKCKYCHAQMSEGEVFCPKCKLSNITTESDLEGKKLSDEELKTIARLVAEDLASSKPFRKAIVKTMLFWVAAILGILGLIHGFSIWDMFSVAQTGVQRDLTQWETNADELVKKAGTEVTNKIVSEFEEPRIRQTVETVAKDQANEILEGQVRPIVSNFQSVVAQRLDAMSTEQDFLGIATRARANDYEAYRRLLFFAAQTNKLGRDASRVISEIDDVLDASRASSTKRVLTETVNNKAFSGPYTSDEIASLSLSQMDAKAREGFVNAIKDTKQRLFVAKLVPNLDQ